jgi:hypothetical protein
MGIRGRLTFGNVMSVIALFIALGGTGYAAVALPKNSVGTSQIKKNGVGGPEIRKNAVRSGEVKNGALRAGDFAAGQLPAGPQGLQGLQGVQGVQGQRGTFGDITTQFEQAAAPLADNTSASYDVHCPDGQRALAGGARGDATDSEFTNVTSSRPIISTTSPGAPVDGGTFTGWRATVLNPTGGAPPGGDILPQVWVICATP